MQQLDNTRQYNMKLPFLLTFNRLGISRRMALVLISLQIYILVLIFYFEQRGIHTELLASMPMIVAAWYFGPTFGSVFAVFLVLSNLSFFYLVSPDTWRALAYESIPVQVLILAGGFAGGWLSRNYQRNFQRAKNLETELEEQQLYEHDLMASEKRYRSMIEQAGDIVILVDAKGKFEYINPLGMRVTGYTLDTLNSIHILELIEPSWRDQVMEFFREQEKNRVSKSSFEFPIVTRNGETRWVQQTTSLLIDQGEVTGYQGILRDITERRLAEQALAKARDEALEANQSKSKLVATLSHDVRTPLNTILGYLDLLHKGAYGEISSEQEEIVSLAIANTWLVTNLINNLLTKSEIESGRLTLNNEPFSPRELLDSIKMVIEFPIEEKGLELVCNLDRRLPETLVGDYRRLQQILLNLTTNAIKFTQNGKIEMELRHHKRKTWQIAVRDTGPGIPKRSREEIFKTFSKLKVKGESDQGTGLGLSIVKEYVSMMEGEIKLDSEVDKGSQFLITLPYLEQE